MVMGDMKLDTELLVIGGGPGGYSAAFRAADLGMDVTLVDPAPHLGGTCLHRGCIPSKTLLFLTELIHDAKRVETMGVSFGPAKIDLNRLNGWIKSVVDDLATGLDNLCRKRGIELLQGKAKFINSTSVRLQGGEISQVRFKNAIIATGSHPSPFGKIGFKQNSRIMSSAEALTLQDIPKKLLILGGGHIGLELGSIYSSFGSRVSLVERKNRILAGLDADLVIPLRHRLESLFDSIQTETVIVGMKESTNRVSVKLTADGQSYTRHFDKVLVCAGRKPNSDRLDLENTDVQLDEQGFVSVNTRQQTKDSHIYAVGDITGGLMLAHKATREGKVAAEIIAEQSSAFDIRALPAVIYTDPQIAWCGLTEEQADKQHIPYNVKKFPWKYSSRSKTTGATAGFTKILANPGDGRILGVGIVGREAENLITEAVLAIEMGALVEDIALCIHPHPTFSETVAEAAELFSGNSTHLLSRKR